MKKLLSLSVVFIFFMAFISPVSFAQDMEEGMSISTETSGVSSKITLELKGVDVLDVLKVLAKKSGLNIVAGKNVRGQVTLFLQDVNVWDALKMVLETSDLAYEKKGDIIKVITESDYEARYGRPYSDQTISEIIKLNYANVQAAKNFLDQIKSNVGRIITDDATNSLIIMDTPKSITTLKQALAVVDVPMQTKVFSLKYSRADDIEDKLSELITTNVGVIKVDERTNKIIVTDVPAKIKQISNIINAFDEKPLQVLIEAKVIEVVLEDEYAFGIDWDLVGERTKNKPYSYNSNSLGGIDIPSTSGPMADVSSSELTTFTINSSGDDFYAVLSVLEAMGKTNTLSNPRVTVLNNEEAKIAVATRQPFVSQTVVQGDNTSTTADNIEFVDVGVTLSVTPSITKDNFILMDVKPEVSTAGSPLTLSSTDTNGESYTRTVVPVVTSQEVETKVLVKSGTTIVLGGLIQDSQAVKEKKVPLLGDIPIVGSVFRNKSDDFKKTELVVFITPYIIHPDINSEEMARFFDKDGNLHSFNEVGGKNSEYYNNSSVSQSFLHNNDKSFWDSANAGDVNYNYSNDDYLQREMALKEAVNSVSLPATAVGKHINRQENENNSETLNNMSVEEMLFSKEPIKATEKTNGRDKSFLRLKKMIFDTLLKSPLLSRLQGKVNVDITVNRDGYIKQLNVNAVSMPELNSAIIIVINNNAPYSVFSDTDTHSEKNYNFSLFI